MTLAKTTNNLCDGHRLYNHTQQSYAQSQCNLYHDTTCSALVYITYIPYLGKRWLSTLTWSEVLKSIKAGNQDGRSPIITIIWKNVKIPSHNSYKHTNTQAHKSHKHISTKSANQAHEPQFAAPSWWCPTKILMHSNANQSSFTA